MARNTPANLLPLQIGRRFDLHQLESGYPLMIDVINIPHDGSREKKERNQKKNIQNNKTLQMLKIKKNTSSFLFVVLLTLS